MNPVDTDVLVVGGGAAGIAAARAAHGAGARVTVASLAGGATSLTGGVAWGHAREPFAAWNDGAFRLGGRYVTVGAWVVANAQGAISSLFDLSSVTGMLGVVDLPTHPSWSARLVAETLGARVVKARDIPVEETFRETAARLDTEGLADGLAATLRADCAGLAGLVFPPVLGLRRTDVPERMSRLLGVPVGEAVGAPGDPPGVRFERALARWIPEGVKVLRARVAVTLGASASATLSSGAAVHAKAVVLATGGLMGAGLVFDQSVREATAGAPVWTRTHRRVYASPGAARGADPVEWFADGQPRGVGVRVDAAQRVLDTDGESALASWLFAAGDVVTGLVGEGLTDALASGARAGTEAARHARGG